MRNLTIIAPDNPGAYRGIEMPLESAIYAVARQCIDAALTQKETP